MTYTASSSSKKVKKQEPTNARDWTVLETLTAVRAQGRQFTQLESNYIQPASEASDGVCGSCRFFNRFPESEFGACEVVEGPIAWFGVCELYIDAQDEAEATLSEVRKAVQAGSVEKVFDSVADLPSRIKERYGKKGQRAFRGAFNSAFTGTCEGREDKEGCAFAIATEAANRAENNVGKMKNWFKKQFGETTEGVPVARQGKIVKSDDMLQICYMPVLVPDIEDAQGDVVTKDEIRKAQNTFSKEYALGEAELGLDHLETLDRDQAYIVENWLEKQDVRYEDELIPEGTWMIGVKIPDEEVWKSALKGERTGASIEGTGTRVAV